ncbi:MAG: RluA family pseudouridine synthase [Candidatus Omnitrophica bacterium]|nr:RluA family pseudouridine synthase [Candidatus Omnitrophota bacterium]
MAAPAQTLRVTEDLASLRLDVFITKAFPKVPSRTYIQRLIDQGQVKVNGKILKAGYKVEVDDEVVVFMDLLDIGDAVAAENIPLNIFYEDQWLLIVNKPVGMLVHPVHGHHGGTLVNALMHHCKTLSDVNLPDDDLDEVNLDPALIRPGIVHRLDRETSGLLVVAKDNNVHVKLAKAFEQRQVKKKYLALVKGRIEFDEGKVDKALGRHPHKRDKKAVVDDDKGKSAITVYRVVRRFGDKATLVSLFPQSGRTHQLRVHMAYLKHPILGDDKYGEVQSFSRLALHAQSLGFYHPELRTFMEFSTPVPDEFLAYGN